MDLARKHIKCISLDRLRMKPSLFPDILKGPLLIWVLEITRLESPVVSNGVLEDTSESVMLQVFLSRKAASKWEILNNLEQSLVIAEQTMACCHPVERLAFLDQGIKLLL